MFKSISGHAHAPMFQYAKDSVIDLHINNVFYPVSYHSERGGRPYQEDRHHALAGKSGTGDASLFAIYDGHGGSKAAQYCRDHLLNYVRELECFESNSYQALEFAFERVNAEFTALARRNDLNDGTTAVVAVVNNRKLSCANLGDSRGILVHRSGKTTAVSIDHCPNRADEEARIRALGGRVIHWGRWRVQGILAVSRAIGDVNLHPYVSGLPEIIEKQLDEDDLFLVLASDGLWDVLKNDEVGRFALQYRDDKKFANIARDLCFEAIILGSTDNVTVQVVDLRTRTAVVNGAGDLAMNGNSFLPSSGDDARPSSGATAVTPNTK